MVTPSRGPAHAVSSSLPMEAGSIPRARPAAKGGFAPPVDPAPRIPRTVFDGHRILEAFGLTSHEARVYLAVVSLGATRARLATESSGLQRATAYRVLGRLVARGLVQVRLGWPREYVALSPRTLVARREGFLRDEVDLGHWLVRAFPVGTGDRSPSGPVRPIEPSLDEPASAPLGPASVRITGIGSATSSSLLHHLQGARRSIEAVVRPLRVPADLRSKVAAVLSRAATRGLHVRVVLDYHAADVRFGSAIQRAVPPHFTNLERRTFTPLAGHFYVVDGRSALRFPVVSGASKEPPFGLLSEDPEFVRAQVVRFETVWDEAIPVKSGRTELPPLTARPAFPLEPAVGSRPSSMGARTLVPGQLSGRLAHPSP